MQALFLWINSGFYLFTIFHALRPQWLGINFPSVPMLSKTLQAEVNNMFHTLTLLKWT